MNKGNKMKIKCFFYLILFSLPIGNNSYAADYYYGGGDSYEISSELFINNGWAKPLDGKMSTGTHWDYESKEYKRTEGFWHGAVDIFAPKRLGANVYSIADGEIIRNYDHDRGYYNMSAIYIKYKTNTDKEFLVIYGHVKLNKNVGRYVKKGEAIGKVMKYATPHIHFGITTNVNYKPLYDKDKGYERFGASEDNFFDPLIFLRENKNSKCAGYSDVPSGNKYCKSIKYAKDNKIMNGYGHGYFYSNDQLINRAEFVQTVVSARNIPLQSIPQCFSDFESSTVWYAAPVCTAKKKGIIKGDNGGGNNTTFRPESHLIYVEALKIALKAYGYTGLEAGTHWYDTYLKEATDKGIDILNPSENVGRDFAAHLLCQINEKILLKNDGGKCSE